MLSHLVLLFIILLSFRSFASADADLKGVAYSEAWLKLLHYEKKFFGNYQSKAIYKEFFLSDKGRENPLLELQETISVLKGRKPIHDYKAPFHCVYPARYQLLLKIWSHLEQKESCHGFEKWKEDLDAGDLHLVFSSAYPNNPASMFGHTFLRFDRKRKGVTQGSKGLLGYSMAFQAKPDPNDNFIVYAFKGITGGYEAYLEIKPYYINVGTYNNTESRDLWEYKIPLTEYEKNLLIAHLWEIASNTGFEYYFFDENCSTYLLNLLQAVKPDWKFDSLHDLFVVPQLTLIEIVDKTHANNFVLRPSIKKQILKRFSYLTTEEKELFSKARTGEDITANLESTMLADTLVDYYKYQNYMHLSRMDATTKDLIKKTLFKRAKMKIVNDSISEELIEEETKQAPHLGHGISFIAAGLGNKQSLLYRYGFHDFFDPDLGQERSSYLSFLEIEARVDSDETYINHLKLAEIISLRDFHPQYIEWSWYIKADMKKTETYMDWPHRFNLYGGVGIAKFYKAFHFYFIPSLKWREEFIKQNTRVAPLFATGVKWYSSDKTFFVLQNELEDQDTFTKMSFNYISRFGIFSIRGDFVEKSSNDIYQLTYGLNF